jgi:hypothetical protein
MDTPFPARLLEEFYSSEHGLFILQCCRGGILEALQSIAEIQSQAYILCKGEGQVLEYFPWTVTYHHSSADQLPESHNIFSMEKTSFWVDFSLRTSCRLKSDAPEMPPEIVASFTQKMASSMSSWSLVSVSSSPLQFARTGGKTAALPGCRSAPCSGEQSTTKTKNSISTPLPPSQHTPTLGDCHPGRLRRGYGQTGRILHQHACRMPQRTVQNQPLPHLLPP